MRSERSDEPLDAKVFRVGECQKSLDRACKKVGADRITHHDLRHLFATRCIESRRGYSNRFPVAGAQGRRGVCNENLRAFAARAQSRPGAACQLCAHCSPAGRNRAVCSEKVKKMRHGRPPINREEKILAEMSEDEKRLEVMIGEKLGNSERSPVRMTFEAACVLYDP